MLTAFSKPSTPWKTALRVQTCRNRNSTSAIPVILCRAKEEMLVFKFHRTSLMIFPNIPI